MRDGSTSPKALGQAFCPSLLLRFLGDRAAPKIHLICPVLRYSGVAASPLGILLWSRVFWNQKYPGISGGHELTNHQQG